MNSQEVSYQFGQLGSAHLQAAGFSIKPPNGMVVVAIQFLDNLKMDIMTVDQSIPLDYTVAAGPNPTHDSFIGITNGNDGVYDDSGSPPKGITIYGRWTEVSLATSGNNGIICYFGV